ncbi:MAG: DUF4007 family protein [Kiritimatiellae bacterium]|nr:DUF4007 family protein [Kiritimatiellia bacterium]
MNKNNTKGKLTSKNGSSSCARYRFSGHQTFVARNGWLEKGVNLILNNPHGFLGSDAVVQLGVGKNMVESIKYWCQQTGLIEDTDVAGTMCLTDLGRFLFGDGKKTGVDPYLEDDASLWLLHYKMVVDAPESTWSIVFNHYNKPEFRKDEMTSFIVRRLSDKGQSISDKTLERDVDCFIRTYAGTRSAGGEESFDSPFLALRLIQATSDTGLYRLNIGRKHNLPDALIGYAILRYMESIGELNVSLVRLLFDPKSPGQVFKLNQGALVDAVLSLGDDRRSKLTYSDTAGLATVQYGGDRLTLAKDVKGILNRYYERRV